MEPLIKNPMLSEKNGPQSIRVDEDASWKPGVLRRFPWLGVVPLILSIWCTGVAIGVVLESDQKPEKDWTGLRQPGVLLAYTSTLANFLMGLAFSQAAVIFFWTQAVKPMPISNLHYYWAGSSSTMGALKSLSHRRAIRASLVTLLVAISGLLRGPLMQRASSVRVVDASINRTINLQVAPNVSNVWAGYFAGAQWANVHFSPGFADVVREFQAKTPIQISGASCDNCTLTVKAFGFDVTNCSTYTEDQYIYNISNSMTATDPVRIFQTDVAVYPTFSDTYSSTVPRFLNITTRRKASRGCIGYLETHTCYLSPASMNYNLNLSQQIVTFQSSSWKDDSVVDTINMTYPETVSSTGTGNTIVPIEVVGKELYTSSSDVICEGTGTWPTITKGLIADLYKGNYSNRYTPCDQFYNDPMDDIINSYRELAFRMSVHAAANPGQDKETGNPLPPVIQKGVPYTSHLTQVQYAANIPALILAVIVSLVGPLATLVLFWGWWELDRKFSLSPLELANAFTWRGKSSPNGKQSSFSLSPSSDYTIRSDLEREGIVVSSDQHMHEKQTRIDGLFVGCGSNASADELAEYFRCKDQGAAEGGEPKIQYGVVYGGGDRLSFAVVEGLEVGAAAHQPKEGSLLQ